MSLAKDSSNNHDFAIPDTVPLNFEEVAKISDEGDDGRSGFGDIKRQKVEGTINQQSSSSQVAVPLPEKAMCRHPGFFAGMCIKCGLRANDHSALPLTYIHKNLRLGNDEMTRLRNKDFKDLLRRRKLYLVLDLDHTLLNSARLSEITEEEAYLNSQTDALPDALKTSLFRVDELEQMTKLRPFVHTFLEEASKLFEMYIYTMAKRPYALKMADLLDPGHKYFHSRIIAREDFTRKHQKRLDNVLGCESAVLILDDKEQVWTKNKDNLILMDKYHFFASSFNGYKSLSLRKSDESETEGALATVLEVLQQIHTLFFEKDDLENRDVRQVLKSVRKEVLKGCKILLPAKLHPLWRVAAQLGATCTTRVDPSVTHVVSEDVGSNNSRWAATENKFLVAKGWIEASNLLWRKQPEENFLLCNANGKE